MSEERIEVRYRTTKATSFGLHKYLVRVNADGTEEELGASPSVGDWSWNNTIEVAGMGHSTGEAPEGIEGTSLASGESVERPELRKVLITGNGVADAWEALKRSGNRVAAADIPYEFRGANSNAFVHTIVQENINLFSIENHQELGDDWITVEGDSIPYYAPGSSVLLKIPDNVSAPEVPDGPYNTGRDMGCPDVLSESNVVSEEEITLKVIAEDIAQAVNTIRFIYWIAITIYDIYVYVPDVPDPECEVDGPNVYCRREPPVPHFSGFATQPTYGGNYGFTIVPVTYLYAVEVTYTPWAYSWIGGDSTGHVSVIDHRSVNQGDGTGVAEAANLFVKHVNEIIDMVAPESADTMAVYIGHLERDIYYGPSGTEYVQDGVAVDSATAAVAGATMMYLRNFKAYGGDVVVKRALRNVLIREGVTAEIMRGEMLTAANYSHYMRNKDFFDMVMEREPASELAANWNQVKRKAEALNLNVLYVDDVNGSEGWKTLLSENGLDIFSTLIKPSGGTLLLEQGSGNSVDIDTLSPGAGSVFYDLSEGEEVETPYKVQGGTDASDAFVGTASTDWFQGGAGADTLNGAAGRDVLDGGAGADALNGGDGEDQLFGGADADALNGGGGRDTYLIQLGDGKDVITDPATETRTVVSGYGKYGATTTTETIVHPHNKLVFGEDISSESLHVELIGTDLWVGIGDRPASSQALQDMAQTVQIKNWQSQFDVFEVEGEEYSASDFRMEFSSTRPQTTGTPGDDRLTGTPSGDIFEGFGGNDSMSGGAGRDTYIIDVNNGQDVIVEPVSTGSYYGTYYEDNTLRFNNISADKIHLDVVSAADGTQDLLIGVGDAALAVGALPTKNTVRIQNWQGQFDRFEVAGLAYSEDSFLSLFDKDYDPTAPPPPPPEPEPTPAPPPAPVPCYGKCYSFPVVLDLAGDGLALVDEKQVYFDMDGDGIADLTSWVGPSDGLLVYDKDGDNRIEDTDEIAFRGYTEGAVSDLDGLRHFDTSGDGWLDAEDVEFEKFHVWQDANVNGVQDEGELLKLAELHIKRIRLTRTPYSDTRLKNAVVIATSRYERTDGTERLVGDLAFAFDGSALDLRQAQEGVRANLLRPENNTGAAAGLNTASYLSIFGSAYEDILRGDTKDNVLRGEGGNDALYGHRGNDRLYGGEGDDKLKGGRGDDELDGGEGTDTAVFSGSLANYALRIDTKTGDVVITDRREGGDGTDRLRGVEKFTFAEGTVDLSKQIQKVVEAIAATEEEDDKQGRLSKTQAQDSIGAVLATPIV